MLKTHESLSAVLRGDEVQTYLQLCLLPSLFRAILRTEVLLFCLRCPTPYNLLIALFLPVWMNYVLLLCSPERKHERGKASAPLHASAPRAPLFP